MSNDSNPILHHSLSKPGLSYWPAYYPEQQATDLLSLLITTVKWSEDHFFAFDRRIDIPRLQAWYADPGVQYRYSDNLLPQQTWLPVLLHIKQAIERHVHHEFNSVLLTYYRNGSDSVGWHADDEQELGPEPWIASLSLGASRIMQYRHKNEALHGEIELHHGDLVLMHPGFQQHWQHQIPAQDDICQPRINLTFRQVSTPA